MTKVIEAIYTDGVLRPLETLDLADQQRVRLTLDLADPSDGDWPEMESTASGREAALRELFDQMDRMDFHLTGPLPTRDELHERR